MKAATAMGLLGIAVGAVLACGSTTNASRASQPGLISEASVAAPIIPTATDAAIQATETPGPIATLIANRMDCAAIAGTAYQSDEERAWYQANCRAPTAVPPVSRQPFGSAQPAQTAAAPKQPFVFDVQPGVSDAERASLTATAERGNQFFARFFGRTLRDQVTFVVNPAASASANSSGQTGGHRITVSVTGAHAQNLLPYSFEKTLVHEMFHVLQNEVGWTSPTWFVEGSAEYVGYSYLIDQGLVSRALVTACEMQIANSGAKPPLSQLVTSQQWAASIQSGIYGMGFMAVDLLIHGNLSVLTSYWQSAGPNGAAAAFQSAFGRTFEQFYSEFETARGTWAATAAQCRR